jgi:hypothetical protein
MSVLVEMLSAVCPKDEGIICTGHNDCAGGRVSEDNSSERNGHTERTMASTAGTSAIAQGGSGEEVIR